MKKLFLDIETLPAPGDKMDLIKSFWEDSRKKNGSKLIKGVNDFDTFFRNTSFQGEFGRICCIGYAVDNNSADCLVEDEKEMLEKFWQIAKDADLFIGHNVMDFDLRFIYKRSIVLGVRPTRDLSFARYRNNPIFDTMCEWEKWGSRGTSLHKLSIALGIASPKEEGIDGSKVYDYFLAGKLDEIAEYCKRDVDATRKVYKRMVFDN
ncbi:MAG: ribonuclease H-like domain-containing protein [Patescibacteria group bacterium]|nr:ribonuclease H-like domain-containing protein [Patescibacteria group bacterium]